jgi:putative ABC transport system substrate-binding protein
MRRIGLAVALAIGCLVAPATPEAQQSGKVYKIGYLAFSTCASQDPNLRQFREALAAIGYVEGKNIVIECGVTAGQPDQNRVAAEKLVKQRVDLIVAQGTAHHQLWLRSARRGRLP